MSLFHIFFVSLSTESVAPTVADVLFFPETAAPLPPPPAADLRLAARDAPYPAFSTAFIMLSLVAVPSTFIELVRRLT